MKKIISISIACIVFFSCTHKTILNNAVADEYATTRITTTSAPDWGEMLRHNDGWLGADGIYSISMNGIEKPGMLNANSQTMFWFSDCIIGHIDAKADTMKAGWGMLNNSVGYMLQPALPLPLRRTGAKCFATTMAGLVPMASTLYL